ncbi:helix-turn-helix domain-containing protein [Virgibacillus kekensis]|uniref:Helix-turn-helix domain-containing protein n=1 Tax=Virgibacillus kekensis TaxID=202261 RepID=A0ABV9DF35_9BACI
MLLDRLLMLCCTRFGEARTVSAAFHLLKGRKSIQTVQDSHIYKLKNYYGIYKTLKKQDFHQRLEVLFKEQVLERVNDSSAVAGLHYQKWLEETNDYKLPAEYFNGIRYYNIAQHFWDRLTLFVQTLTNSFNGNLQFIPVSENSTATEWMRVKYQEIKSNEAAYLQILHDELETIFRYLNDREASIIVDSLTGYKLHGMSSFQLAEQHNLKRLDVPLILTAVIHQLLFLIEQKKQEFPIIASMLDDMPVDSRLTNSAKKTNQLLYQHRSVEEIAAIRQLRLNTIYDHLVEIALYDKQFSVDDFVNKQHQKEITSALDTVASNKLKDIKAQVNEDISYFEIRLVLAAENPIIVGEE